MKNIIKTILIISFAVLVTCTFAHAQTELDIANQRLDKTLDILKARDVEIADLKNAIVKLQQAQQTPCSIAVDSTSKDLIGWLERFSASNEITRPEVKKVLKIKRKEAERVVKTQCNITNKSAAAVIFDQLKTIAPVALLILLKR
jgi:hypothetical protein